MRLQEVFMGKTMINKRCFIHHPNMEKQIGAMRSMYPSFRAIKKDNKLIFVGLLQVREDLPEYKVRIEYNGSLDPYVFVDRPKLVDNAPHVYRATKRLCLYHPANYNWNADKLIAKDIVPWTAAWIYFYEYWLRTGEWVGPEAPHGKVKVEY